MLGRTVYQMRVPRSYQVRLIKQGSLLWPNRDIEGVESVCVSVTGVGGATVSVTVLDGA